MTIWIKPITGIGFFVDDLQDYQIKGLKEIDQSYVLIQENGVYGLSTDNYVSKDMVEEMKKKIKDVVRGIQLDFKIEL